MRKYSKFCENGNVFRAESSLRWKNVTVSHRQKYRTDLYDIPSSVEP